MIVIGGGIIGLSLSLELRKQGARVLVIDKGEPGKEASSAAGGMLVDHSAETSPALQPLAAASARMYPEFADELKLVSGISVDLRDQGTIVFPLPEHVCKQRLPGKIFCVFVFKYINRVCVQFFSYVFQHLI